jgi:integrase
MTTGARRGEICALRRSYVDLNAAVLTIPRSVSEIELKEKASGDRPVRAADVRGDRGEALSANRSPPRSLRRQALSELAGREACPTSCPTTKGRPWAQPSLGCPCAERQRGCPHH